MFKPRRVSATEAFEALRQGCTLLDVREPMEQALECAEGACSAPLSSLKIDKLALDPSQSLYLLCKSGTRAQKAAEQFIAAGFQDVRVIEGGMQAWAQAGLPVQRNDPKKTWSLERQVRFTAGVLGLTGFLLAWLLHPAFLALSIFVSAGLTFSGLSDWCGMGLLLARMPWNRVAKVS
jgi:rhodanese-related sulfurtransferase